MTIPRIAAAAWLAVAVLLVACGEPPARGAATSASASAVAATPIPVLPTPAGASRPPPAGAVWLPALDASTAWTPCAGNPRVTGRLPAGWLDDSGWCQTWIDYAPQVEDGRPYWRATVLRRVDGRAQIAFPLPAVAEEGVFRLTARLRASGLDGVEFGLRQRGAPYEWLWNHQPGMTGAWQDFAWTFRLDGHDQPVGFYFGLDGVGRLDIAELRLERWPLAEYLAATAPPPAGGPKNLLRITRAPLGVPTGWTIDRDDSDGDEVVAEGDAAVRGPSGAAALRLRTAKPEAALWCGALGLSGGGVRHVASLWLRGTGRGRLAVLADGRQLGEAAFALAADGGWQRVEVPFVAVALAQVHALRLSFTGALWLDALQVERGERATAYAAPRPCEVVLRHDSPGRLQFTPEVAVEVAVSGATAGAVVMSEVIDAYGRRVRLPDVPAAGSIIRCAALADRPYGPLRIEATAVSADGRALSEPAEMVIVRLPRPRHWGEDAPDSFFGVHTNSTTRHNLMAKAMGANWVRGHDAGQYTTWHQLEPEQGVWRFRDADIQRYRAQHLKMLGMLSTAPRWASTVGDDHEGYFDQYYQPKDLEAWQAYVRTVTARYRGVIDAWELWNEPWGDAFWHLAKDHGKRAWIAGPTPAADYARLSRLAYEAAKQVDPRLTILGFNTCDGRPDWTREVRDAGALPWCDVVSYHQYEAAPGGSADDRMARGWRSALGALLDADGRPPKPVWLSEGSPLVMVTDSGFYRLSHPGADPQDVFGPGDRCARFLVSLLARDVRRAFIYSMHCHSYFAPRGACRSLITADGYLHPSASAYAACAWHLEDTRPAGIAEVAAGVTAFAFQGAGRAVAVLSPQAGHAGYRLPAGCAAADLFGNPLPAGSELGGTVVYLSAPGAASALLALAGAR